MVLMIPPAVRLVLGLPAYIVGVCALFYIFEGAALTGFLKWWRFSGPRSDVRAALDYMKAFFRYRVLKLPGPDVYQGKCVYLTNHRAWCDFFVDMWVTGARSQPLSRLAVGMAFPAFTSSLIAIKSILLFNRAGVKDTERFNTWLDSELVQGPQNSLLVYPEGTRSLKNQSLPLKRGMLRYAFTRRLPVQAVITAGKEEVMNERKHWVHFNRTLVTGCSEVIETSQYEDFEEFMEVVQKTWDAQWERVHSAPRTGFPELVPHFPELRYTPKTLALESAALAFWTAVPAALLYFTLRVLLRLAASAPVGTAVVAILGVWTLASLAAAFLLPPPASRPKGGARGGAAAGPSSGSTAAAAGASAKED